MNSNYFIDNLELPAFLSRPFNYAYGDNYTAALYCGFTNVPNPINAEWQHGWIIPERNCIPDFVIGSDGLSATRKNKKYLVARADQVHYLKTEGFTNVTSVGLPIVYTQKPNVSRKKGSLLVMPVHSLSDTEENWDDEAYAAYIESISHQFTEVVLCLHIACFKKGNWMNAFKKRNIEMVIGADPDDCNTFKRLAILFSRFEFVTSNEFGSHLAYAAYFGAKPSIAGPKPKFEKKDYEKTVFYKNAPKVLDIVEQWYLEDFFKKRYAFLYINPAEANECIDWAAFQLGDDQRKSPAELKKLLGWTLFEKIKYKVKSLVNAIR